jgi:vacuolar protein sorting-associated protein 13A/C
LSRQDTFSSAEAFEAVTEQVEISLSVVIDLGGIGLSLVNKRMVEVLYATIDNLKFEYTDSTTAQAVNLACGNLQIDNQLHDALYPVILQPTPIPKDTSGVGALPTVQGSVIWLKDQGMPTPVRDFVSNSHTSFRTWSAFCQIFLNFATSIDNRDR